MIAWRVPIVIAKIGGDDYDTATTISATD